MHFYVVKLSILGFYLSDFGSAFYSDRGVYFAKMCQKCISYVLGSILGDFYENRKLISKGPSQYDVVTRFFHERSVLNRRNMILKLQFWAIQRILPLLTKLGSNEVRQSYIELKKYPP